MIHTGRRLSSVLFQVRGLMFFRGQLPVEPTLSVVSSRTTGTMNPDDDAAMAGLWRWLRSSMKV
ncbi:hypothetical protein PSMK_21470 [Phycisphaera mikurensis NBRC 102666]|uniref:Uncharacterized protein n=1 Tax=Phycisphaera mikurensis (strain NBRC 102666 / KCTC 22515 / FYK2301M01) TaxID=1142394 RepID=I0IGB8_PHYMF|nr:hypothetical protein PSMK_21470 [Phycisphaera mikurensis NBRC 102666]